MNGFTKVLVGIAGLIVVAAVVVAMYLGGFWVSKDATNRQYQVNVNTQQYQAGLVAQERDLARGIATTDSEGLKKNLGMQFCSIFPNLTIVPADIQDVHDQICN